MRKLRLAALPVLLIAATSQPAAALELFDRFIEFAQKHAPRKSAEEGGLTPLRIGLMLPESGEFTEAADRIERGWRIASALSNNIVAQRPIEIVRADTGNLPALALENAIHIASDRPIDVYAGIMSARVAQAMALFATNTDTPVVIAGAIGKNVMSGPCNPRVVRTSFNVRPYQETVARYLVKKHDTVVTLVPDVPGGHNLIQRFTDTYKAAGGRIVEQLWAPNGRKYDWSGWLTRSSTGGPKMIYAIFEGKNAERLVYRYSRTGLKRQIALVGPEWMFGPRTLVRRGKHASGLRFLTSYLPDRDTTANRLFVGAYRKVYGEDPDMYAYLGYENALAVLLTVSDRGGDTSDAASFIASMKALDYTALMPRGPFSFNKSNSAWLSTLNWVEVHHRDGETWLKKLDMIPVDPDNSSCRVEQARASH